MRINMRSVWRSGTVAVRALVFFTFLTVLYTLAVTGISRVAFPSQAAGSLLYGKDGQVVGSSLIGQNFAATKEDEAKYFQSRPSAAGDDGYDALASGGSNYGPNSEKLLAEVQERKEKIAKENGVSADKIPVDALTASSSGLDPDISVDYALLQAPRVAKTRGLKLEIVKELIERHTAGRDFGYLGVPHVNVLELNLSLDNLKG